MLSDIVIRRDWAPGHIPRLVMMGERQTLRIRCTRCKFFGLFRADSMEDAADKAFRAGWRMNGKTVDAGFSCPRCTGAKPIEEPPPLAA